MSDSLDFLQDLAKSVRENHNTQTQETPQNHEAIGKRAVNKGRFIAKSGPGGVIMNFGGHSGHSYVDNWNTLLSQNSDLVQEQTANSQNAGFNKALEDFVDQGEVAYTQRQQNPSQNVSSKEMKDKIAYEEAKKSWSQTTAMVGGKKVEATSETDQAILEMFKNEAME